MTVKIESSASGSQTIVIEKTVNEVNNNQQNIQQQTQVVETVRYVQPQYNINIIDSLGGFFILAASVLLIVKLFGGSDFFGSIVRGVATLVGGAILFVYAFGMAIL